LHFLIELIQLLLKATNFSMNYCSKVQYYQLKIALSVFEKNPFHDRLFFRQNCSLLCALILSETLALYKSFTYLLTYFSSARMFCQWLPSSAKLASIFDTLCAAASPLGDRCATGQESIHLSDKHRQHPVTALRVLESRERVSRR